MSNQRVNQVLGDPYGDKTVGNYLNPAASHCRHLARWEHGSSEHSPVPAPGSSTRLFPERSSFVKDRGWNFGRKHSTSRTASIMNDPTTNLNSNTFGQVTSAKDPRIMQFALKYFF